MTENDSPAFSANFSRAYHSWPSIHADEATASPAVPHRSSPDEKLQDCVNERRGIVASVAAKSQK
jgi:hypothetical protein